MSNEHARILDWRISCSAVGQIHVRDLVGILFFFAAQFLPQWPTIPVFAKVCRWLVRQRVWYCFLALYLLSDLVSKLRTIASLKVFPPRLEGGDLQLNGLQTLSDRSGLWHERKVLNESDQMMKLYQESGWFFASVNSVHLEMWNNHSITLVGHLGQKTQIHVGRCGCMCCPLFACVPFIWWRRNNQVHRYLQVVVNERQMRITCNWQNKWIKRR